jgi:hypothetical protein
MAGDTRESQVSQMLDHFKWNCAGAHGDQRVSFCYCMYEAIGTNENWGKLRNILVW